MVILPVKIFIEEMYQYPDRSCFRLRKQKELLLDSIY